MHKAPWTKISISTGDLAHRFSMADRDSSRDRTTRVIPKSAQALMPSRSWTVIWVEA